MTSVLAQTDFYKTGHYRMYPEGTSRIHSNFTPRKSRMKGVNSVVMFGLQYFILEYLIKKWNEDFFALGTREELDEENKSRHRKSLVTLRTKIISKYKRLMDCTLGIGAVDVTHLEHLWNLGYMPLEIRALPEGSLCPIGVPCFTVENTVDEAYWLVNYLETIISCTVWQPMTSGTIALEFRKLLNKYANETTGSTDLVQWQGHDFSMRGMGSLESATTSGAGHLLSFTGTDTVPAIEFMEEYYGANIETELVGASVPATEHSVMCMGSKEGEIDTFIRLLNLYPKGILSVVSDTWNLWTVLTDYLPTLKKEVLARDGKLVIRPDSGDPADIICGLDSNPEFKSSLTGEDKTPMQKGAVDLLWEVFGGTVNAQGYKVLDSHIGVIYGDSISLERAKDILDRLKAKGFASTNIVFGIGSYTYQYVTRDTFGFAMKATYGEVETNTFGEFADQGLNKKIECREIFKDPITDDGTKKSARGLLKVLRKDGTFVLQDRCSREEQQASDNALEIVFKDGVLVKEQKLSEIRSLMAEHYKV